MDERGTDAARRSVVIAPTGMVATSQPLAVQVGVAILRAGGTAVDAAIAVNAMLGLVEPMSCGIGGDLFAIVWEDRSRSLIGLNGSGRSPHSLSRETLTDKGFRQIPLRGPLSWTIPGCVDGWFALHERFGRLPITDILAPAIHYAKTGFPVTPVIARAWQEATKMLSEDPCAAETFLHCGKAPTCGAVFRNPDLADTLSLIANNGKDAFYRGRITREIVSFSNKVGGYLSAADFSGHSSSWVKPVSVSYHGYEVWELPPNTQGLAVLEMLQIIAGFDPEGLGRNSTDYLHLLIEAKKLAYADRARFYADPDYSDVPVEGLIEEGYARGQRARINLKKAAARVPAGDPCLNNGDTVYLTVVDGDRNAVSFIQSVYRGFGSGIVPGHLGFVLQNRGTLFSLDRDHPNRLEPHKRPFHTIIPGFVTHKGQPVFSFGVMGGDQQPQGQVQILLNIIDFHMDAQRAGDALRFRHAGSCSPTGYAMRDGGIVYLEPGIPAAVATGLRKKGHCVEYRQDGYGGYQGIWMDPVTNMLYGGSEPRQDGCAIGY